MAEVIQTETFSTWLTALKDAKARNRILARIRMAGEGHFGDAKRLSSKVSEMRIDVGPGYRVYYTTRGPLLIVLLVGGDKSTQTADIRRAEKLAGQLG